MRTSKEENFGTWVATVAYPYSFITAGLTIFSYFIKILKHWLKLIEGSKWHL